MYSVSGSMLEIYSTQRCRKQVTNVSLLLKDSDTESENLSSLVRLSVSDGQKPDSSNVYRYIIFRDYLMAFWLSPEVSTRDPIVSPRTSARGLIVVEG